GVKVRAWLIQDDEEWIAVEGACQADSLALSGGKRHTALANPRAVSVRKRQNEIMDSRFAGGFEYSLCLCHRIKAGDVGGDASFEQFDVLREVTDGDADRIGARLFQTSMIETYFCVGAWPN